MPGSVFWIRPFPLTSLLVMSQTNIAEPQVSDSTAATSGAPSGPGHIPNDSAQTAQESATPLHKNKAAWGGGGLLAILVAFYFIGYDKYSSQGHFYFWPESTVDWGVWGTWAAVLVGGGAVFYAATQVRLAAVSQREDRQQRINAEQQEKVRHRELVAAQDRLKEDQDRDARIGAKMLAFEAGLGSLPMARSEEEHFEREGARYAQTQEEEAKGIEFNYGDEHPSIRTIDYVYVHLTNRSEETTFHDLSLQFGVNVAAVVLETVEKRTLGPALSIDSAPRLAIDTKAALSPVTNMGVTQWLLPKLAPREQVRATFRFQVPQIELDWWGVSSPDHEDTRQLHQRISLGFRGPGQRYWICLTDQDANEQPFRLWELGD